MRSSGPDVAELERAGLYEPSAPDAAERLALLEYLIGRGATLDDLLADGPDDLPVVATRLGLWTDHERLTVDETAAASGVSPELVRRVWRAAGFPDPEPDAKVLTRDDVALFSTLSAATPLVGEEVALQLIRVLGQAAARVADAAVTAFVVNVGPPVLRSDPSGLALARANTEAVALVPQISHGFDLLLRHQLEAARRPVDSSVVRQGVEIQSRSVGFVDLVGSTMLANTLEPRDLAAALARFDATASEVVTEHNGRVVKLIGDEIMFVAADADTAADIALALVETFADDEVLPPVRGAVAAGEVVARDGDYAGAVVNLAARAAKVSRPSTILVDAAERSGLDRARFVTRDAGAHRLKGFDRRVRLFRLRRNGSG